MSALLDLSFTIKNGRVAAAEYPEQVAEIMQKIAAEGFNSHDPERPGESIYITLEDMQWALVRDSDCMGNAEVDSSRQSIHIRFDQLDFKLAAYHNSTVWRSTTLVRVKQPILRRHRENVTPERDPGRPMSLISGQVATRLRIVEDPQSDSGLEVVEAGDELAVEIEKPAELA